MAEGEVNIKPITNVDQIVKAFKNAVDNMEKIDKKKAKFAVNQLLDVKVYLEQFFAFAGDISRVIQNHAADVDSKIIKSQTDLTNLLKSSLDIIKNITEIKMPNLLQFKWQLWKVKHRFMMLVDLFFDTKNGIAGYLKKLDNGGEIEQYDEDKGQMIKKKISNFEQLNEMVKNFSETAEEINKIITTTIMSSKIAIKQAVKINVGFRAVRKIFSEYALLVQGEDFDMIKHGTDKIQAVSNNINEFAKIVNNVINTFSGKTIELKLARRAVKVAVKAIRELIVDINNINKDENGKPMRLVDRSSMFEMLNKQINLIGNIIENIKIFNLGTLIATLIARITIDKILKNVKIVINKISDFVAEISQLDISDVGDSIIVVKNVIDAMLGIIGGIVLLALASAVLIISVPVALTSISLVILFVKVALKEFQWLSKGNMQEEFLTSAKDLGVVIMIIIGSMVVAATGIVLLAIIGMKMLVVIKPALLTFVIVGVVVWAIAKLAQLISILMNDVVGTEIYKGLLTILALIGTMLVVATSLILLALVGQVLVKNHIWLYALGVIAGVALLMTAIAGLGLLIMIMLPAIIASTIALSLTTISVTAILLTASELILLSKLEFDNEMVATIKENVSNVVNTALDIIGMIFQDVQEDSMTGGHTSQFVLFFKTIFKGAAVMIQALTASVLLVLTFVSVTMIILISLELWLVAKIKIDKDEVRSSVNDIMMAAEYCINAIFGDYNEPATKKSSKEKYNRFVDRVLSGIGDIISLIFGIAKLALIIVTVTLILFVALSLKLLLFTAKNLKPGEIKEAVETILGCADYCIDIIFEDVDEPSETNKGSKFDRFIDKFFTGISDILTIIMGIGRLVFTLVSVGVVLFIAQALKKIIETAQDFDKGAIESSLNTILSCADYCRDLIWNPTGPKYAMESKDQGFGQKFIGFVSGVFKNIGDSIGALMSIGRVATTLVAVGMIVFLAESFQKIHEAAQNLSKEGLIKDVTAILGASDLVITTLNNSKFESLTKDKMRSLKKMSKIFNRFLSMVETYKSITKESVDNIVYAINQIVPLVNSFEITVDTKKQKTFYKNIGRFIEIINVKLEQTREGIDLIVYAINQIIPAMNAIKLDIKNTELLKTFVALKQFIQIINFKFLQTRESIDTIVYAIDQIVPALGRIKITGAASSIKSLFEFDGIINKLVSSFSFDYDKINNGSQSIVDVVEKINNNEINPERISSIDDLANVVIRLFDSFNKNSKNTERGMNKSIEFLNKVNDVKLENLKTTARLFEKMANFSETINGNFDGLADALNDKIAPLIEKLNTALEETKTIMQDSEATIGRAKVLAEEINTKTEESKTTLDTNKIKEHKESIDDMNFESTNIATNLRDIKKLLAGTTTQAGGKGLKVQISK